ncbi:MAG TPA: hypothetical protein VFI54_15775 [Solirubrobacteraceae bacterium]|nr:hypothetical protein [Solirubrobacteraceae bacterium]
MPVWIVAVVIAIGCLELVLLAIWQRNGYWDFSDGVYAMSARQFVHGLLPYRDFATAQPPPVYLAGAALLAVHDGLWSLRAGLGLVDLATAVLVAVSVWQMTERAVPAMVAGGVAMLLPISLHEHAQLTPETLAAPLLLLGAIWSARSARASAAGGVLALAAACKVAFAAPALAIIVTTRWRRSVGLAFVLVAAVLAAASFLVFGSGLWRGAVEAQLQVGRNSVHDVAGLLSQAAWNELPLLIGAILALVYARRRIPESRDPELVRTLAACAGGGLLLGLTVFKQGSYINVLVVAEPPLLALAVAGAAWAWTRAAGSRLLIGAVCALLGLQSLSLLTSPSDPWLARRPLAASGLEWNQSPSTTSREVTAARNCPPSRAYSGAPYIAFLARRRMPGSQPDLFILEQASANRVFARQAAADRPLCP